MESNIVFDLASYLKDLEYLVNIDSGSGNPEGVAEIAEFFRKRYTDLGLQVVVHQFDPTVGPCLEISSSSEGPYDLLFMGHMDTVFPIGTVAERPFTVKGNLAHGPGVNDMKSGLLYIFYVAKNLHQTAKLANSSICIVLNSDEEISSRFSRPWLEKLSKDSKHVFVLEAARTDGNLVNRRKGVGRYNITLTGVAAHSGVNPEQGSSAIQELAHWILALHERTNYATGTTVNVGVVSGGIAVNVVADKAKAEVDLRFFETKEAQAFEELLQELTDHPRTPGVEAVVTGGVTRPPMKPSDQTLELCKEFEIIGAELGVHVDWTTTGGGSDGCFSAFLGVPTIDGLGPVGGGSHGINEYLQIESIEPRYNLLYRFTQHVLDKR